jgi:hypothetical protein
MRLGRRTHVNLFNWGECLLNRHSIGRASWHGQLSKHLQGDENVKAMQHSNEGQRCTSRVEPQSAPPECKRCVQRGGRRGSGFGV